MKKSAFLHASRLLSIILIVTLVASSAAFTASADIITKGQTISGVGTVKSVTSYDVTDGLSYSGFTFNDTSGTGQSGYVMEFNPDASGLIPMLYQPKPSTGSTVKNTVSKAKEAGYTVYGGINGEFFSMASGNYGTLEGLIITNGKISADAASRTNPSNQNPTADNREVVLAIDSSGAMQLVESRISYHFYVEGKEKGAIIGTVNKRYNGNNWWDPLCYFDSDIGNKTYTISGCPGIEVVFNKINGTELIVNGTLQGEVASIKENTYGSSFGENQFVLFAQKSSANYGYLSGLKVGQKVQIYAEETCEEAKSILETAITASSANYPVVVNGKNNIANLKYKSADIAGSTVHPQRTAIGVKADGTYVFFCSAGRSLGGIDSNNYGLTINQIAQMMISLGCVTAVNLDGGGSSTMVAGNTTVFQADPSSMRSVGSTVLITTRTNSKTQSSSKKQALSNLVAEASTGSYGSAQTTVNSLIAQSNGILANANANTGDYQRLYMKLQEAMGKVTSIQPKDYISLSADDWAYDSSVLQAANDGSALVLNNTNGQWPNASYSCKMAVPANYTFNYDLTINGAASIHLIANGVDTTINTLIAPSNIDSGSGDILGYGRTYKGSCKVSDMGLSSSFFDTQGNLLLTGLNIYVVGSAGNGSKMTIRDFSFTGANGKPGDVSGDNDVNSSDGRMILRYLSGKTNFTDQQLAAADYNGDGEVGTSDVRAILRYTASLT
ncbi:MAG: phosphodiester glycosidase family protein [Clostridia bacterium]|nr:phosphodiester glycosidase family protein [Clostridia bacterium]